MKSRTFAVLALASSLAIGAASPSWAFVPGGCRGPIHNELGNVTRDLDRADSLFGPGKMTDPFVQKHYRDEYAMARLAYQDGQCNEALEHLRKTDQIIRSLPDWQETE